jgi:hypothetical protein
MAVPVTNQSWKVWQTNGSPVGGMNYLIDTYTISYCDGTTLRTLDVELRLKSVSQSFTFINSVPVIEFQQKVTATPTSAPIGSSVTLNIKSAFREREDFPPDQPPEEIWLQNPGSIDTLTWAAGDSAEKEMADTFYLLERQVEGEDRISDPEGGDGGGAFGVTNYQQTFWGEGVNVVSCAPPPPSCTLEITGTTATNETFTGDADGTITIGISGSTGTTTYYLDNANAQSSNVFTGLTEGTYSVQITEGSCFDEVTNIIIAAGEFRSQPFNVTEPNNFLASENPIVTTLRTATNATPAFAQTSFQFTGVTDGQSVAFDLTNPQAYTATFTAKDFPNRENYFVTPTLRNRAGVEVGSNTDNEIATTFAEAVAKDITISRYYFIDTSGDTVTLTAKQASSRLTLNTNNVTVSSGITMTTITDGVDQFEGSIVSNYSLYTDVYVGAPNTQYGVDLSTVDYDNYTSLELPFSQDNTHRFDVSDVMKNFVSTPKIDLTFTGFTYITSMIRPFYIKYGESYPLITNENTKKKRRKGDTGYKWVLNSSLDFENANDVSVYFTGGSFLTNAPNPLQVQRNQTSYLYFILEKDQGATLTLKGDIEFYDGTSQSGQTFINITSGSTNLGGVYCLNTSYAALGLAAYEASGNTKIKRVTFGIYADDVLASEQRVYRFEIDEQPRRFGVSFENKLGAYDTFDFVGIVEDSITRTNKNYTIPRQINNNGSSPVGFKNEAMFDTQVTKTITVNSGWIDQDHFDWLIELMQSNNIYSYTEDNQNYLNVTGFTYTKSSLDDLYELEITFKLTIFENSVSV